MKKNVGGLDRVVRIVLGIAGIVIGLVVSMATWGEVVLVVVGAILVVTAFVSF
ncbi:MAG: DUF2892 domain-containing protein [Nitrospirota bacterium]|jgi:hypothetical protein